MWTPANFWPALALLAMVQLTGFKRCRRMLD
jgi:hypothetical protein